jgi:hypothetical protein
MISAEMFDDLQQEWAPLNDPVFQLTPSSFHNQADTHYTSLGRPGISRGTFWDVYKSLLACFRNGPTDKTLEEEFNLANLGAEQDDIELISGLQPLRIGDEIVGDGVVLQDDYYAADFTDEEDSFEEDSSG